MRSVRLEQPFQQQVLHQYTYEHAAITAVLLLGSVIHVDELERPLQELLQLHARGVGFSVVTRRQRVVVERYAVDDADEQEGPVRAALGVRGVGAVVYGEEDVRGLAEVGESAAEGHGVRCVLEEVGHAGAEKDNLSFGEGAELFPLDVPVNMSLLSFFLLLLFLLFLDAGGWLGGRTNSCQNAMAWTK